MSNATSTTCDPLRTPRCMWTCPVRILGRVLESIEALHRSDVQSTHQLASWPSSPGSQDGVVHQHGIRRLGTGRRIWPSSWIQRWPIPALPRHIGRRIAHWQLPRLHLEQRTLKRSPHRRPLGRRAAVAPWSARSRARVNRLDTSAYITTARSCVLRYDGDVTIWRTLSYYEPADARTFDRNSSMQNDVATSISRINRIAPSARNSS